MAKEIKNKKTAASNMADKNHPQSNNLSTEYVQDSDSQEEENSDSNSTSDDDSLPENPTADVAKRHGQTKTPAAGSSSSSGSESESEGSSQESQEKELPSRQDKKKHSANTDSMRYTPFTVF